MSEQSFVDYVSQASDANRSAPERRALGAAE